jgi:hypothetical protein
VRVAGERLDVERLCVLPVDPVADAAQPREVAQVLRRGGAAGHLKIVPHRGGPQVSTRRLTFGNAFLCTGTLIAPNWVLTAGHCGSVTGAAVASPAAWPPQLITVRIGSVEPARARRSRSGASSSSRTTW